MSHQQAVWFGDGDGWTHGGQLGMSESPSNSPSSSFYWRLGFPREKLYVLYLKQVHGGKAIQPPLPPFFPPFLTYYLTFCSCQV